MDAMFSLLAPEGEFILHEAAVIDRYRDDIMRTMYVPPELMRREPVVPAMSRTVTVHVVAGTEAFKSPRSSDMAQMIADIDRVEPTPATRFARFQGRVREHFANAFDRWRL